MENAYLIVLPLPRSYEGLHCTLLPWFVYDGDLAQLKDALTQVFWDNAERAFGPLPLVGEEPALFGPALDIPVMRVSKNGTLAKLHASLCDAVSQMGAKFRNPEWAGEGYRPHVTAAAGRALQAGEHVRAEFAHLLSDSEQGGQRMICLWRLYL